MDVTHATVTNLTPDPAPPAPARSRPAATPDHQGTSPCSRMAQPRDSPGWTSTRPGLPIRSRSPLPARRQRMGDSICCVSTALAGRQR
jgi:hypothetical protein